MGVRRAVVGTVEEVRAASFFISPVHLAFLFLIDSNYFYLTQLIFVLTVDRKVTARSVVAVVFVYMQRSDVNAKNVVGLGYVCTIVAETPAKTVPDHGFVSIKSLRIDARIAAAQLTVGMIVEEIVALLVVKDLLKQSNHSRSRNINRKNKTKQG